MKKLTYDQYGDLNGLKLADVPMPVVKKDSLLVRVKAASINPLDRKIWQGDMKILTGFRFPRSVGIDFAGVVEQVGSGVAGFRPGDEVMGLADIFNGGAMAEYVVAKAETVVHKPAGISVEQAAALPVVGASAIQIFDKLAPVQAGTEVLIIGATGGIGTIAIQVARRRGARVTAVTGPNGVALAKRLGSDQVINYRQENLPDRAAAYDVVLDLSGKVPFNQVERQLKPKSVYVSTLPSPAVLLGAFVHNLFSNRKRKVLNLSPSRAYLDQIARYAAEGLVEVVVSHTYPITAFKQAYTEAARGGFPGKAVLTVA